jgi:hypothetical protein
LTQKTPNATHGSIAPWMTFGVFVFLGLDDCFKKNVEGFMPSDNLN